jgi:hypothetical protein
MSMLGQRPCRSGSPQGVRGTVHLLVVLLAAVADFVPSDADDDP